MSEHLLGEIVGSWVPMLLGGAFLWYFVIRPSKDMKDLDKDIAARRQRENEQWEEMRKQTACWSG